jgi:protein-L-isoaspartate(D-aspartate) O-methyltransferase
MEGSTSAEDEFADARRRMVDGIVGYSAAHRVDDRRILDAMLAVPRHEFVPESMRYLSYADAPLGIGEGQTISQPFMVAYMTQLLELRPSDRVLEIGTGSGYQTAILARLAREVYTVEIHETLAVRAQTVLKSLGYKNIFMRVADGYWGWPEAAPFAAIIVTCAPERVPPPLIEQLQIEGRLVIPVGPRVGPVSSQELVLIRKTAQGPSTESRMDVRFVPMTGEARNGG